MMFPLKERINTGFYGNKQQHMSHSFHTFTTGVLVVNQYTTAPVVCCVPIWTPSSRQQDTQSFICPLIGFQSESLQAFRFWFTENPTDLHARSAAAVLSRPHQSAGGPWLTHIHDAVDEVRQ